MMERPPSRYDQFYPVFRWRSYLAWGIVLSLLIHVMSAPLLGRFRLRSDDKTEAARKISIEKIPLVTPRPTPAPTATPTPPPATPQPQKAVPTPAPQRLKLAPPKQKSHPRSANSEGRFTPVKGVVDPNGNIALGAGPAGPGGAGTGALPGPVATGRAACAVPDANAHTVNQTVPEYPDAARIAGATGVTEVRVALSSTGVVTGLDILKSSGNKALDAAALQAARSSTYAPDIRNCEPVPGTYRFVAEFQQ
jgi:protein TonB